MKYGWMFFAICLLSTGAWAAPTVAPAVPDLTLPDEQETPRETPSRPVVIYKNVASAPNKPATRPVIQKPTQKSVQKVTPQKEVVVTNASINKADDYVEKINPDLSKLTPIPTLSELKEVEPKAEFEPVRDNAPASVPQKPLKVAYNPVSDRDPTLSPDDTLLIKDIQEKERRRAEAERKQRLEAERRRIAEAERQRQSPRLSGKPVLCGRIRRLPPSGDDQQRQRLPCLYG